MSAQQVEGGVYRARDTETAMTIEYSLQPVDLYALYLCSYRKLPWWDSRRRSWVLSVVLLLSGGVFILEAVGFAAGHHPALS